MNNKLTGREALAYMATGGWFRSGELSESIYQQNEFGSCTYYNNGRLLPSDRLTYHIIKYGITPCPDPTVKIDEYAQDRCRVLEAPVYPTLEDERVAMVLFFEKWFQRKEVEL